jgi:ornithine cyclodeaminase/alanine dehydrogenase-like protein (mu-crystallin family)
LGIAAYKLDLRATNFTGQGLWRILLDDFAAPRKMRAESFHMSILFLAGDDVRKALPMAEAIGLMRQAFERLSRREVVMPTRQVVRVREDQAKLLLMPASLPANNRMGVKVVTMLEHAAVVDLPRLHALMLLFDGTTGRPLAVMDGASLTALRTGAASGAATGLLARPDADTVAILGAGVQGRTQLEAVCAVRTIRRAWIYDTDNEVLEEFCWDMSRALKTSVVAANSAEAAVRQARIVCTATTSASPVFSNADIKPGTHINAVGSYRADVQEIPAETVLRARIVIDHRESALAEAGDLLVPLQQKAITEDRLQTELGEILSGQKPGRMSSDEVTLFKSVGVAAQDIETAAWIYEQAEQFGLGTEIAF